MIFFERDELLLIRVIQKLFSPFFMLLNKQWKGYRMITFRRKLLYFLVNVYVFTDIKKINKHISIM